MMLDKIKARRNSIPTSKLLEIQKISEAAYKLIIKDILWLIERKEIQQDFKRILEEIEKQQRILTKEEYDLMKDCTRKIEDLLA